MVGGGRLRLFDNISLPGERREAVSWETPATITCDARSEGEGLYYSNARWYEPTTGRFITEDPARDGAAWYVYCYNNPLRYVDPTGLRAENEVGEGIMYDDATGTYYDTSGSRLDIDADDVSEELAERHADRMTPEDRPEIRDLIKEARLAELGKYDVVAYAAARADEAARAAATRESWWSKKSGERLTREEAGIQMTVGFGEMALGLSGVVLCPLAGQPGGVFVSLWVMADGANLLSAGANMEKRNPAGMFLQLATPVSVMKVGANEMPYAQPLP